MEKILNQIGYIYRLLGEWQHLRILWKGTSGIGKSSIRLTVIQWRVYKTIWASLWRFKDSTCVENFTVRRQLISRLQSGTKEIGRGETTLAAIYRDRGDYQLAEDFLNRAQARFEEPHDSLELVRVSFQLGWTQWYKGEDLDSVGVLSEGKKKFEKSLQLAEK